ncbi:MAG: reverse transcriptase domain-containing protein [Sedimenticola sp.]
MKISSININGMRSKGKHFSIKDFVHQHNIDILLVQETFIDNFYVSKQINRFFNIDKFCVWGYGNNNSCGVAIMVFNKNIKIEKFHTDLDGRLAYIDFSLENFDNYRLINIYAPNVPGDRREYFDLLVPHLTCAKNLIIAGDFNFVMDTNLDKIGGNANKGMLTSKLFKNIIKTFSLEDAFRILYPDKKSVTFSNKSIATRLDRVYVASNLRNAVESFDINPCSKSDHDFITLELKSGSGILFGKPYWKFNDSLLDDGKFRRLFRYFWQIIGNTDGLTLDWWDEMKLKIMQFSQDFSKSKNKAIFGEIKDLKTKYRTLDVNDESYLHTLHEIKDNIRILENKIHRGAIIRSKANILDTNENPTKYFFQLEASKGKKKTIQKITDEGKTTFSNSKDILNGFQAFYRNLYSEEGVDEDLNNIFLEGLPQVSVTDTMLLSSRITKDEIYFALKDMQAGKSPGCDGISPSFYVTFFDIFGPILETMYGHAYSQGKLTLTQRSSYITLICKDEKNAENMKNYRPISLLNTDYKILSKVITNRLSKILPKIISVDQTCSIKGRSIFDNLHLLRNVCDYIDQKDLQAAFICLDQEKAFDRVSWSYMYSTLQAFGFDNDSINWIKLLYTDINSCVIVNNHISSPFDISRGVRQGCPLSPLLYVLCFEPFAVKIRKDDSIKGITVPGKGSDIKISMYADDNTGILTTDKSIKKYLYWAKLFGRISGSKINYNKSKGIFFGKWKNRSDHPFGISWAKNHKIFGYHFGHDNTEDDIWANHLRNINNTLQLWKSRLLSMKGKSTVLNSLCVSKLLYYAAATLIPSHYSTLLQRYFFNFIWNSTYEPVARKTLYMPFRDGGLNVPNIKLKLEALYISHVQKLINNYDATWTYFARYWVGIQLREHNASLASNLIPHSESVPPFYDRCLSAFKKITSIKPDINFKSNFPSKIFYIILSSDSREAPKVEGIFPTVNFSSSWNNLHESCIDPVTRDTIWRICHDVIYVNYYLYRKHISKCRTCPFCGKVETVRHLFIECAAVSPLNKIILRLLGRLSNNSVKFSELTFRFFNLPPLEKHAKHISLILLSESRYAIWKCRNMKKYDSKAITSYVIVSLFLNRLKLRILADFRRLENGKFLDFWLKSGMFCKFENEEIAFLPDISIETYFAYVPADG